VTVDISKTYTEMDTSNRCKGPADTLEVSHSVGRLLVHRFRIALTDEDLLDGESERREWRVNHAVRRLLAGNVFQPQIR
jgi:hypothetical protein